MLLKYPDPRLKRKSRIIDACENVNMDLVAEIFHYLADPGVKSIAAPQLDFPMRVIGFKWGGENIILINPVLSGTSDATHQTIEGCLSIPGRFFKVTRCKIVTVVGKLLRGETRRFRAHDLDAASLQHELDHLEGILIADKGMEVRARHVSS